MVELSRFVVDRIVKNLSRDGWQVEPADVQLVYDTGNHSSSNLAAAIIEQLQEYDLL